jgi:hypothetical protein
MRGHLGNPRHVGFSLSQSTLTPFPFLDGQEDSLRDPQGSIGKGPSGNQLPARIDIDQLLALPYRAS